MPIIINFGIIYFPNERFSSVAQLLMAAQLELSSSVQGEERVITNMGHLEMTLMVLAFFNAMLTVQVVHLLMSAF